MKLGNKIIKLRKEKKLSQEELADKIGVSRQTISNWELNITKPDVSQLKKFSKIFYNPRMFPVGCHKSFYFL